jgi:hypothetical protein
MDYANTFGPTELSAAHFEALFRIVLLERLRLLLCLLGAPVSCTGRFASHLWDQRFSGMHTLFDHLAVVVAVCCTHFSGVVYWLCNQEITNFAAVLYASLTGTVPEMSYDREATQRSNWHPGTVTQPQRRR